LCLGARFDAARKFHLGDDLVRHFGRATGHVDPGFGDEIHRAQFQRPQRGLQPRSVSEETMSTGRGCARISFSRKVSPSMRGISTSSVITSGWRRWILSHAAYGSAAEPITSIAGSRERDVRHHLPHRCRIVDN
jgi:hypothetical protein